MFFGTVGGSSLSNKCTNTNTNYIYIESWYVTCFLISIQTTSSISKGSCSHVGIFVAMVAEGSPCEHGSVGSNAMLHNSHHIEAAAHHEQSAAAQASHGHASHVASRCGSGPCFSMAELELLLDCIKDILPLGLEEWENIAKAWYASGYPEHMCDAQSLRCKFQGLYNMQAPMAGGDPSSVKKNPLIYMGI